MNGVSFLVLYVPITLVILLVIEACRTDDPRRIFRRSFSNFGVLSLVLLVGCAVAYLINRYL
jgi:hypothetical protein